MNKNKVAVLKALADETRLAIAEELGKHKQMGCGEISEKFELSQPALSHHFKKLCDANVITAQKDGVHMIYTLNKKYLKTLGITV